MLCIFITTELNRPLAIESDSYSGASCRGTFTRGHVGADCLESTSFG